MGYVGNKADSNYSSIDKQIITGNGGTGYTLSHSVANANEIEVFVNNVRQDPGVAYTVNNAALTMTGAVANTDSFYVVFIGKAVQTKVPADGSVGTAKIANAAVSTTKIADGAVTAAKIAAGAVSVVAVQATAPSSPAQGDMWFNTSSSIVSGISSKALAVYNGTAWQKSTTGIVMTATGGIKRTSGLYTYHTFTSSGTFSVSQTAGIIDSLVIAGGGGGGHDNGGGGGAGGVVWTTSANVATGNYTVTIGAGGAPSVAGGTNPAGSGANSIFKTATALGGGGAGGSSTNGANGGSGGGGARTRVGGSSTQGASGGTAFANSASASTNSGFEGGGGGGAGAAGTAGTSGALGSGGIGVSTFVNSSATETTSFLLAALAGTDSSNVATTSSSSGTLYIAGGGAGGSQNSVTAATTAAGGGAPSVANTNATGANGLVNTGSGGGSSGTGSGTGGSGGSGIVIVRYLT